MNLILHIGTEKTGTTSIQEFLKNNADQLGKNGVYIPQTPMVGSGNHRWVTLFAANDSFTDDFVVSQQFKCHTDRRMKISFKRAQFLSECKNAASKCSTLILTSEHFQSRLRSIEEIKRLRDLLKDIFSKIRIVLYIRDPLKTAVSLLSTAIKCGGAPTILPSPDNEYYENICNHGQTISRWKEGFPDAEFLIRRFERTLLTEGDVVIDFCSQVMDNFKACEYSFARPSNETLTLTGMVLLRRLNLEFPRFIENKLNPMRGKIDRFVIENTSDGSSFQPCRGEFEMYRNHFRESLERVRTQYFSSDRSLFVDQKEFAEKRIDLSDLKVDTRVYEKLIASLWSQKRELELARLWETPG